MAQVGGFVLEQRLGRGSAGAVWRARAPDGGEAVAVKLLAGERPSERDRRAFRRELASLARLDHEAIVRLIDAGVTARADGDVPAGTPWLALELASGSLADLPPASWDELRPVLDAVLRGLAHAHARGLLHCDLKPENLLRTARGWTLADFGIAHAFLDGGPARVAGTPATMALEQWRADASLLGPWTDLYALGATVWRVVTGDPPADVTLDDPSPARGAVAPGAFRPRFVVPPGLEGWLRRALDPAPEARWPTAAAARAALIRSVDGGPVPPLPVDAREPAPPRAPVGLGLFGWRTLPIVGREAAQDRLWALFREVVATGRGQALAIRGAPGCGRSALAEWLTCRVAELGAATTLRAVHHVPPAAEDGLPGMLARHLRLRGLDPAAARDRVHALLPETSEAVLGLVRPDEGEVLAARAHPGAALLGVRELAAGAPVVVWLDDVSRCVESIEFLRLAAQAPFPILAVATADEAPNPPLDHLPGLSIGPLGDQATWTLLRGVLGLTS